jgi:hypothetical protein
MPVEEISFAEYRRLFVGSRRAFHLEMKDEYHVTDEDEPFQQFLAGETVDLEWLADWLEHIRDATSTGVAVQRVRIVTEPLNDYARFLLAMSPNNIEAGEDIRYLPSGKAAGIELPKEDCWLFDDNNLVLVMFAGDGRSYAFYLPEDPGLTARYVRVRDQIWGRAIPYAEYVT